MGRRVLSPEEVAALGLEAPEPKRRVLSSQEVEALGLEGPSTGRSFALGASQGGTLGFADELGGLLGKLLLRKSNVQVGDAKPGDSAEALAIIDQAKKDQAARPSSYQQVRDLMRGELQQAKDEHGGAVLAGEVLSGLALPVPGGAGAQGAKLGGRLLRAALQGGAMGAGYGAGSSEADLLKGDVAGLARDTGIGAGVGALGGAVAEGVTSGGRALVRSVRDRASKGVREAVEQETAAQRALAEKSIRGKVGEYRSAVQSASRDVEVMAREAAALPEGHPLRTEVESFLSSPDGMALREQVAKTKLETGPERIAEMKAKLDELRQLVAGKEANVEAMTAEALSNPVQKHIKPRVLTLGHRVLPTAMAAAGGVVGGPAGAAVGGAVGTAQSLSQGLPGRIVKNLMDKPAVRKATWEKVLSMLPAEDIARDTETLQRLGNPTLQVLLEALRRPRQDE